MVPRSEYRMGMTTVRWTVTVLACLVLAAMPAAHGALPLEDPGTPWTPEVPAPPTGPSVPLGPPGPNPLPEDPPGPLGDDEPLCYYNSAIEPPKPPEGAPDVTPCRPGGGGVPDHSAGPGIDARPLGVDAPEAGTPSRSLGHRPDAAPAPSTSRAGDQAAGPAVGRPGHLPVIVALSVVLALAVPAWILYRRLTRDDLLDHPSRSAVIEVLEDHPGATAADVARRADMNYDTVRYHLRLLEEFDEVTTRRPDGKIRYFPNHGRHSRDEADLLAILADATREAIARALLEADGLYAGEVAERAGVAPSTASHHLGRLTEAGVVDRTRRGNHVRYELAPKARRLVRRAVGA